MATVTIRDFEAHLRERGRAENTIENYARTVRLYAKWYQETFGQEPVQLYRINILDYIAYLRTVRRLSNRSVNAALAALLAWNELLIERGIQTDRVLCEKDYLKVQVHYASPSKVTKEEVEAFRQAVLIDSGVRNYALVTVLAYAGLRISEALDLHVSDVDMVAREITVRHGKGDKGRVVFFGDKIANAVQEYLRVRPDTDSPYLFISRQGGRLSRSSANRICNDYSDTITPHLLRHFYCSSAIEAGYSINELANQAGHSNVHTTLLYTNPTRRKMLEKANLL